MPEEETPITWPEAKQKVATANDFTDWASLRAALSPDNYATAEQYAADFYLLGGDRGGVRPPNNGGRI